MVNTDDPLSIWATAYIYNMQDNKGLQRSYRSPPHGVRWLAGLVGRSAWRPDRAREKATVRNGHISNLPAR